MRVKHNKKRNTAFLYEVLARELTKSIIHNETVRSVRVKNIIKEFFNERQPMGRELSCYTPLMQKVNTTELVAQKIILECKRRHSKIDEHEVFNEQSRLIKRINVDLGKEVFNTFVPNYRSYATVAQIFSSKTPISHQVLLEEKIAKTLLSPLEEVADSLEGADSLVVKNFVNRFNDEYKVLLPEQKELLKKYITSFGDSAVDFQLYLGGQLQKIHQQVSESLISEEVQNDEDMEKNTHEVLERINNFNVSEIGTKELLGILKLQNLANEYKKDAD